MEKIVANFIGKNLILITVSLNIISTGHMNILKVIKTSSGCIGELLPVAFVIRLKI